MIQFFNDTPLIAFVLLALTLGLAPFFPEPHIWEKIKMLRAGSLTRPLDIFDLLLHLLPWLALLVKLGLMARGA